jgi:CBS domain containing-hemolysin-like protein
LKLLRVPPPRHDQHLYTPDELELIVSESVAGGMLETREQEMVANIFDFHERRAGQIMIPRTRMAAIAVDISESDLLALVARTPHSRLPVYKGDVDHIVGMLHLKDFVRQQLAGQPFELDPLLRQIPFVPESQPVETLLASFKRLHLHMAIVIDEHGGVAGLVTLEDLIEEVFGEVRDEFDTAEEEPLIVLAPGHIRAQGTVLLDDLEEEVSIGTHEYSNDVNTIGGLVMAELGRPPQVGDKVNIGNIAVQVENVEGMAIKHVVLRFDPDHKD